MKKIYKYVLLIISIAFLGYHSIYFEKLSEVRAQEDVEFDFQAFADSLFYKEMQKSNHAIELSTLLSEIQTNSEETFEKYGNRLGIGKSAYFMVKSSGKITEITDELILLFTEDLEELNINTKYIFGNALRDASGLVKLTDFKTNAEFNQVSEALNALIRKEIIPQTIEKLKVGDQIEVIGAIKLSKKNLDDPILSITPSQINSK